MYIPEAFREDDIDVLHAFIQGHKFAILITMQDGVPLATYLPLILDREAAFSLHGKNTSKHVPSR